VERWYAPGAKKRTVREQHRQKAWYLPRSDDDKKEELDRDIELADNKHSGGTQVFDGNDY